MIKHSNALFTCKKAQALIISLWVLVILTVLTVSVGHRVSMALHLSSYQKDKLKALYLAKAGVNCVIAELERDLNSYDGLTENWVDNEEIFGKIMFTDNQNEFAVVSYVLKEDGRDEIKFGVVDEEKKININTANKELLISLLEGYEVNGAADLANNILIWRGTLDNGNSYEGLGYVAKGSSFSNIEELTLVKGITLDDYLKIKKIITVCGNGRINLNTVSLQVLKVFCRALANELSLSQEAADKLAQKIISLRDEKGYFQAISEVDIVFSDSNETNVFNSLKDNSVFKSQNFLIEVSGNVGRIRTRVSVIYNRDDKKVLFWHEN